MYKLGDHLKRRGFFGIPCIIAERKELHALPSSARLTLFLLYQVAHRVSSPRFRANETTLAKEVGHDPKTLRSSLAVLGQARQLRKTAGKGRNLPSEIWLTNPETGVPFPVPKDLSVPTFRGFSKAERTGGTEPETERTAAKKHPRAAPAPQQTAKSVPAVLAERPASSLSVGAPEPERLCNIPGHHVVNCRADGSKFCGQCHPTGISEPPRKIAASQPTGAELFGDRWSGLAGGKSSRG